jgi:hypothetical protein
VLLRRPRRRTTAAYGATADLSSAHGCAGASPADTCPAPVGSGMTRIKKPADEQVLGLVRRTLFVSRGLTGPVIGEVRDQQIEDVQD